MAAIKTTTAAKKNGSTTITAAAKKKNGSAAATKRYGSTAAAKRYGSTAAAKKNGSTTVTAAAKKKNGSAAATKRYGSTAAAKKNGSTAAAKKNGSTAAAKRYGSTAAAKRYGSARATKKNGSARATQKPKVISADELAALVGITYKPKLKSSEVQRLRRALPGYVNLLDDVAELLEEDADVLRVKDVSPDDLLRVQAAHKELSACEAVLEAVYLSAYHQRLVLDHEGIGMLQKIARRINALAEDHPDMPLRYKSLLDFLSTFRRGGRPTKGGAHDNEALSEGA